MTTPSPAELRDVGAADVYIGATLAATLTRTGHDEITFAYINEAPPGTNEAPPGTPLRSRSVSWSLLADAAYPVVTTGGAVPPFFAGLLPEGVRLGAVIASTKTSMDDHLTLLLAVGADTVGDIRAAPAGSDPPPSAPMFSPERDTDFREVFTRLTGGVEADPVALAGVQPKVSAATWSVPTRTASGPAIFKLTPPTGFPKLSENEAFFLRMARACGLRVPKCQLICDLHGRSGLLIARFDRQGPLRIAQEDACQVAGVYPASKYRMKAETAIAALADACGRGNGSRVAATLELLRTVVFCWMIGNGDLHGKNLSIHAPAGIWQPTPAYDLVTTQPYTGWRDPMAMTLYGRADRFSRADFVDAGVRLGLRQRAVERMIDSVAEPAAEWPDRCSEIGFGKRQTELLAELLRKRIRTLTGSESRES